MGLAAQALHPLVHQIADLLLSKNLSNARSDCVETWNFGPVSLQLWLEHLVIIFLDIGVGYPSGNTEPQIDEFQDRKPFADMIFNFRLRESMCRQKCVPPGIGFAVVLSARGNGLSQIGYGLRDLPRRNLGNSGLKQTLPIDQCAVDDTIQSTLRSVVRRRFDRGLECREAHFVVNIAGQNRLLPDDSHHPIEDRTALCAGLCLSAEKYRRAQHREQKHRTKPAPGPCQARRYIRAAA